MTVKVAYTLICLIAFSTVHAQLEKKQDANKKIGFTNDQGDWVIKPIYEDAQEFYDSPFTFVKTKGKWILIDRMGTSVLPFVYDKIMDIDYDNKRLVMRNGRHGMVDIIRGNEFIESKYDVDVVPGDSYLNGDMYILVQLNKKIGLLTPSGEELIPCLYDPVKYPFEDAGNGFYKVWQNKKAGLIDSTGNLIVPCQFDGVSVSDVNETTINVKRKNKYGLYSTTGKEIIAPIYDSEIVYDTPEFAIVKQNKKYGVVDRDGKLIVPCIFPNDDEAYLKWEELQKKD